MTAQSPHRFLNLSPSHHATHTTSSLDSTVEDPLSVAVGEANDSPSSEVQQKARRSSSVITASSDTDKGATAGGDKATMPFAKTSTFLRNGH